MSPNFWGCRCCGGSRDITIRALDSNGVELWSWGDHGLAWSGVYYRNDGFCLSPDGYVGHCGGRADPTSIGVLDPDGQTVWQSVNDVLVTHGGEVFGLIFPAFDPDLNLYAILDRTLVSYDINGVKRWTRTLPNPTSGADGVRCRGGAVYVQCFSSGKKIIAAYDYDGNLTGQKDYYSTAGLYGAGSSTFHVNANGHAMMMNEFPEEIDVIDDTCTTISTIPFTMNHTPSIFNVRWPVYDMSEVSNGDVVAVGTQYHSSFSGANVVYNMTIDDEVFRPLSAWNSVTDSYITSANSSIDGDNGIYCVENRLVSGERIARTVRKYDESGSVIFTIVETGDVEVVAIPGMFLLASNVPRPRLGWTIS